MSSVCLGDNSTSVSISGDNSLHAFTSGGQCASGVFSCTCEAVDLVLATFANGGSSSCSAQSS